MAHNLTDEQYADREDWFNAAIADLRDVFTKHQMGGGDAINCMAALQGMILQEQSTPDQWSKQIQTIAQLVNEQCCWVNPSRFGHH